MLDRKDSISPEPSDQNGATTFPFGWTNCSAPSPWVELTGVIAGAHVSPPSLEVLIQTRFPLPLSSHSM